MTTLSSFLVIMLAISLSAERMVEVLKGWMSNHWLFRSQMDPVQEARRCAWIHCLSGLCGGIAAAVSQVDLFRIIGSKWADPGHGAWHYAYWGGGCTLAGLLASGGSAFWNHALDIVKATKVDKEQAAIDAVAANQRRDLVVQAHPAAYTLAMQPSVVDPSRPKS